MIDSHVHPLAVDEKKYPINPLGGQRSDWSVGVTMSGEDLLGYFTPAGVTAGVLVQAGTVYGYDNRFCVETAAAHPGRFVSVITIDPVADGAVETLESWAQQGAKGLRLMVQASTTGEADWLEDPKTFPVWQRAEQLGMPMTLQMRASAVPGARRVLDRFPNLKVALDHIARPKLDDGPPYGQAEHVLALSELPNVYVKFSPYTFKESNDGKSTTRAFFETLLARFGARRMIWGTNFPNHRGSDGAPYKDLVDEALGALDWVSPADRDWLFGGTVASLYPDLRS